jgi:hypothetical protein
MAPTGELVMALPIFVDETGALLDGAVAGLRSMSFRVCQEVGYILYHPEFGESVWSTGAKDLFIDLGEL